RQYGWDESRNTHEIGLNSRLDSLQAAILHAKLPYLDADNIRRAAIASRYDRAFAGLPLTLPAACPESTHVYHLYVVRCDERDRLSAHLAADQIGSTVHYPVPVHQQHGYAERVIVTGGGLPVTAGLAAKILSLPIYPELSDAEVDLVIASIRRFYARPR
ncbi:MAG TPA: DegT/DnrJ/EryC1/StrS family aminotransferase, partial [Anaerolineae bacterium]